MVINPLKIPETEAKTNTFSKSIMSVILLLYIMGSILGAVLVMLSVTMDIRLGMRIDPSMFMAYGAYLGGPTTTAIIFYAWKAKAENVIKIGKTFDLEHQMETIDLLSKMGGN